MQATYNTGSRKQTSSGKIILITAIIIALGVSVTVGVYFGFFNGNKSPPGAPTNVIAIAGDSRVTLTWTAPSSDAGSAITGYKIYMSTLPGTEKLIASNVLGTSYMIVNLNNGKTYYFDVAAVSSNGVSVNSSETSILVPMVYHLPKAPVLVDSVSGTMVGLTWSSQVQISSYKVYHATNDLLTDAKLIATLAGTTGFYFDTTAGVNGANFYFVDAANDTGTATSNVVSVNLIVPTATGVQVPQSPVLVLTVSGTANSPIITLTWNAQASVTSYAIYHMTTATGTGTLVSTQSGSILLYVDTTATYGSHYYYIIASNSAGTATSNMVNTNIVNNILPAAVTGFSVNLLTTSVKVVNDAGTGYYIMHFYAAHISWTAAATNGGGPILGYYVYMGKTGATPALVSTVTSTIWTSGTLDDGSTYQFTVIAFNAAGNGPISNTASLAMPSS